MNSPLKSASGAGCLLRLSPQASPGDQRHYAATAKGSRSFCGGVFLVAWLSAAALTHAAQRLLDFEASAELARVTVSDATMDLVGSTATGRALRIRTGTSQPWPGITLKAPGGRWDLSAFAQVNLTMRNTGSNQVTVCCRMDNDGADGVKNCVTGSIGLDAGKSGTLTVPLKRAVEDKLGGKLFGLRGYPVKAGNEGCLDAARVTQLVVFVTKPTTPHTFDLEDIRATGTYMPPTAWVTDAEPFFPLIDTFGQYEHKDWPGKVHSLAELRQRKEQEANELGATSGFKDWCQYGGWTTGPQRQATGFFRTEKLQGKWWLVDPDGHLFFSHGIDCVRMLDVTPIEERENWFADFPGHLPEFAEFLHPAYCLKGHYAGRSPKCFSFASANFQRKYGADWKRIYPDVIHRRLRGWGLNTIGMWSDEGVRLLRRTPYVDAIGSSRAKMIQGSEGYWGKFPDVFDPGFRDSLRRQMAGKQGGSAGDPWCLGYFSDNEMSWGDEVSLPLGALASPPEQAAKQALIADLKAKYGDIAKLNAAWGADYGSWDVLLQSGTKPDRAKPGDDLRAFYTKTAEQYFRTVREAIKEVAPNQLYLGCRFAWVNARAAAAAAKYCDVVSYNLYQRSVADFQFNGGADVPLIIGEFHFGALDRGMFHTGLVPTANQEARAQAYKDYVLGALRHPQFVGCHWFQWQDEPTTGRVYDEENYQIGFVDIADTPYAETIAASRTVAKEMYRVRMGK